MKFPGSIFFTVAVSVALIMLAGECARVSAQTPHSAISVAPGPCIGNANGQNIPVWKGTGIGCITESQYSSLPAGSWNVCLSGVGTFENGAWHCSPSASSAAYSQIYVNCMLYGLGVSIGCSNSTWAEDLISGFVPDVSWVNAAVAIGDLIVNRKPGYNTFCDLASYVTSVGDSLPLTIGGAGVDTFCQFVPTNPPNGGYNITITSPTGRITNVTINVTPGSTAPTITSITSFQASNGVIPAAAGSQLLQFTGTEFLPSLTVTEIPPTGSTISLAAPKVQDLSGTGFIVAVDFGGNPGVYGFQVVDPDGSTSKVFNLTVGSATPAAPSDLRAVVH